GGIGTIAASEAADRARRRGLPAVAPRSRPARAAIRPDAGDPAAGAPALARGLASRLVKRRAPLRAPARARLAVSGSSTLFIGQCLWGNIRRGSNNVQITRR